MKEDYNMQKIRDFIKPFFSIIFGGLLFLDYLNLLASNGPALALGIIAVILSVYYIAIGILGLILGDKLPKKIFNIISVALFPAFMFVFFLIFIIGMADVFGPTAWIIYILGMVSSISLAIIYCVSSFVKEKVLNRITLIFGAVFTLSLVLVVLFDVQGDVQLLGNIAIVNVVIFALYTSMFFTALPEGKKEEPVKEETASSEEETETVEESPSEE